MTTRKQALNELADLMEKHGMHFAPSLNMERGCYEEALWDNQIPMFFVRDVYSCDDIRDLANQQEGGENTLDSDSNT